MLQHILSSSCTSLLSSPVSVGFGFVLRWRPYFYRKWKNDTNPQSCSSAPLPSPVVPASHSKQKHALFSLTHMHKNTQMTSSLFHLLFHMCLCLSLTHCPLFGIRVRASISTVVNTSTLPWPEQIIPAPLCFFFDEISSEAKARKALRKHSYISLRGS